MDQIKKFCEQLMFLHPPWEVGEVSCVAGGQDGNPGMVTIRLSYRKGELVPCPVCGQRFKRHGTKVREWRDLDLMGWRTVLRAAVPRANCPEHGVRQAAVPWAEPYSRQTMRFETEAVDDLLQMNVRQMARKRGLSWNRTDGIQARAVARGLARRDLQPPRRIGIDETSFQQRHEYVTLVVEHGPARVLHVADGKGRSAIDPFFKGLGEAACERLEAAAMDMAPACIGAVEEHTCADICIDRFHVAKLLNEAVDQVRRAEHRALMEQGDLSLKGTRYDWLMGEERMGPERRRRLKELRRQDLKVARAWVLKERAAESWSIRDRRLAYWAWQAWRRAAQRSRLKPMVKAAATVWRHVEEIINAAMLGFTNALSESINSKAQWLKRQACGYRSRDRFRRAIYFHLGKLDLYPRTEFHTNV